MKIRKAVIPAAGLGTRLLPATKAVPKEMLPLADTPTIQYIIEEAVASGIEHVIIVTSRTKRAIEDYFDESPELRTALEKKGDRAKLEMIDRIESMVQISFTRQPQAHGLGHAILMAKDLVGDEPFGVLLGDDLVVNASGEPCLKQLMNVHERHSGCVVAAMRVPPEQTRLYGVIDVMPGAQVDARTFRVRNLVEKPEPSAAPSNLAVMGRYVLTPDIFTALEQTAPGAGGEIQLTDGLCALLPRQPIYAHEFEGVRYDTGDPVGYLTTSLAFALQRPDLAPGVMRFLKTLRLD